MLFSSLTHTLATLNSNQELKQINHSTNTRGVNHTHMYLWNYKYISYRFSWAKPKKRGCKPKLSRTPKRRVF